MAAQFHLAINIHPQPHQALRLWTSEGDSEAMRGDGGQITCGTEHGDFGVCWPSRGEVSRLQCSGTAEACSERVHSECNAYGGIGMEGQMNGRCGAISTVV